MTNLEKHADKELKLAGINSSDADYGGELYEAVMELVRTFANQGHSGGSAARTLQLFKKVASYELLTPLSGKDSEWNDIGNDSFQNNRDPRVFKQGKDGRAYFLNAIVWRTQIGSTWSGKSKEGITSRQYIRSFPFTPKTFYVDVIQKEVAKDDWEFTIKDSKQLEEVKAVYDYGTMA